MQHIAAKKSHHKSTPIFQSGVPLRKIKSLGQHFLRSKEVLRKIIEAAAIKSGETVLEIGPGEGALTEALLLAGARVIAVETDTRCVRKLEERFTDHLNKKRLLLISGDIKQDEVQKKIFHKEFLGQSLYKLVANIPYYITGMLFRLFLEKLRQPSALVFLVQKEVAEQIVAREGKESILSLSVKIYGTPRYVAKVKREAFSPPPKVDSAIVAVTDISRERLAGFTDEEYFRAVKTGLGAKRKMLFGNLARAPLRPPSDGQGLKIPKEELLKIFNALGIDEHVRGEDVPAEKWPILAQEIKNVKSML